MQVLSEAKEFSFVPGQIEKPVLSRGKYPYTPLFFTINFFGMLLQNDYRRVYNYKTKSAPNYVIPRHCPITADDKYDRPKIKAMFEGYVDIRYKQAKATQKFDLESNNKRILEFILLPETLKNRRAELTLRTIAKQYQAWFDEQYKPKQKKKKGIVPKIKDLVGLLSLEPEVILEKIQNLDLSNLSESFKNKLNKKLGTNIENSSPTLWFDLICVKDVLPNGKMVYERRRTRGYNSFVAAMNSIKNRPINRLYSPLPKIGTISNVCYPTDEIYQVLDTSSNKPIVVKEFYSFEEADFFVKSNKDKSYEIKKLDLEKSASIMPNGPQSLVLPTDYPHNQLI